MREKIYKEQKSFSVIPLIVSLFLAAVLLNRQMIWQIIPVLLKTLLKQRRKKRRKGKPESGETETKSEPITTE